MADKTVDGREAVVERTGRYSQRVLSVHVVTAQHIVFHYLFE